MRGEYRDRKVVIAAGAWSSELLSNLDLHIPRTMPVRGHLIAYAGVPGMLGPILRHGHHYILQRSNGTVIAGSSTEHAGFSRHLDETLLLDLQTRAASLFPALAGLSPVERWNGFRPGIEAAGPLIGRIGQTNIWAAFGHYRNGILLAPETARMIADDIHP